MFPCRTKVFQQELMVVLKIFALFQTMQPTVFDSGEVINDDISDLVHKLEREIRSVRTVSHTTTSSWKHSHELGIEISYTPPGATGINDFLFSCVSLLSLFFNRRNFARGTSFSTKIVQQQNLK